MNIARKTDTSNGAARPVALPLNADAIPAELRQLPQWVVWHYTEEIDQATGEIAYNKPPLSARGGAASSTNPKTWSPFDVAIDAYAKKKLDGIGFVLNAKKGEEGTALVAVDLDHCRNPQTGEIEPWASEIIAQMNSYTEVSPSGCGIRIFVFGKLPPHGRKHGNFECYCTARYVTVTGQRIAGTPVTIERRETELLAIHRRFFPEPQETKKQPSGAAPIADLCDLELIEKAKKAKNGARFSALWNGDTSGYGSASEADLALVGHLAFWCGPNGSERIDALFRQSGLFRSKWNREDYRTRTIRKAMDGRSEFYRPRKRPSANGTHAAAVPNKAEKQPQSDSFAVGPLSFVPGQPRQTASGKISLPVSVTRGGEIVFLFVISSAASSRREPERIVRQLLGNGPANDEIDGVLTRLLAHAASQLAHAPEPSGPTVYEILADMVPESLALACRTPKGLWSERRGTEITRTDFVTNITPQMIVEAGKGADAPRNPSGFVIRPDLIRAINQELTVLWSHLMSTLPPAEHADLSQKTERGRQFRLEMIRLWKTPQTWEKQTTANGDTATKASLASRAVTKFKRVVHSGDRTKWEPIHPACDAWFRPHPCTDGEVRPLLALRWTLPAQVGIELPGVVDEESLTRLGKRFGVIADPPEGVPSRLSGGKHRIAVLSLALAEELLESPAENPEDNPREPGAEG